MATKKSIGGGGPRPAMADIAKIVEKCQKDPVFFIMNYVKVQSPNMGGTIPFTLYPFQQDLLRNMQKFRYTVVNKSRQLGITTVASAFCLWYCLFHTSQSVAAIATRAATAKEFLRKVQFGYDRLPDWLKEIFPIKENNASSVAWQNGSKVMAEGRSTSALRGQAISWLIVDEAAFIEGFDGPDGIWASIWPVLSTGGRCLMLSSPSGASGKFYETFTRAKNGENDWKWMELPWSVHPERDQDWFEKERRNVGDERIIRQEYCCDFSVAGDAVLSPELQEYMNSMVHAYLTNPVIADNRYWEWDRPIPGETYVIGADVAGGSGDDFSTIQVLRAATGMQVAEFKGKILPEDFAMLLTKVGKFWNEAIVCSENNSIAQAMFTVLKQIGYPKVYGEDKRGMPVVTYVYAGFEEGDVTLGFNTQEGSRKRLITEMIQTMEKKRVTSMSQRLKDEFSTFVWRNNKPQHSKGSNDDLIMAWAFAIWCRESVVGHAKMNEEMTLALANAISVSHNRPSQGNNGHGSNDPFGYGNLHNRNVHQGIYTSKNQQANLNRGGYMQRSGMDSFYTGVAIGNTPTTGRVRTKYGQPV